MGLFILSLFNVFLFFFFLFIVSCEVTYKHNYDIYNNIFLFHELAIIFLVHELAIF